MVAPRELEVTTKARSHDDTVLVADHFQAALVPVLAEMLRVRSAEKHLFLLTLNAYGKPYREYGTGMGFTTDFVPHSLRHCGSANDLYHHRRDMAALAKRGRWANIKSVQRYGKSGRLVKVWRQLSERSRARWTLDAPGKEHFFWPPCAVFLLAIAASDRRARGQSWPRHSRTSTWVEMTVGRVSLPASSVFDAYFLILAGSVATVDFSPRYARFGL